MGKTKYITIIFVGLILIVCCVYYVKMHTTDMPEDTFYVDELRAVEQNGKWGFADEDGKIVIPFEYDEVRNFSEGLAAVKVINHEGIPEWGYIDQSGNIVIDLQICNPAEGRMEYIGDFKNGVAFVTRELYCLIDKEGKVLCGEESYFFISSCIYYPEWNAVQGYVYVDEEMVVKKYGLFTVDGEPLVEPIYDYIGEMNGNYVEVGNYVNGELQKEEITINSTWNIDQYLRKEVPELSTYEEYIKQNSNGKASLIIETYRVYEDGFFLIYVGEQWEDHRANWDYFLVNFKKDRIFFFDMTEDVRLTLEEWRESPYYRNL